MVCAPDHPRAGSRVARLADLRLERWIAFPEVPGRREITASHVFALFQTHGLGEIDWTPVDSLTAQKRLIEAGLAIALLARSHVADELRSSTLATIGVGDLAAHQDIVAVTRRGGLLECGVSPLAGNDPRALRSRQHCSRWSVTMNRHALAPRNETTDTIRRRRTATTRELREQRVDTHHQHTGRCAMRDTRAAAALFELLGYFDLRFGRWRILQCLLDLTQAELFLADHREQVFRYVDLKPSFVASWSRLTEVLPSRCKVFSTIARPVAMVS